MARTSAYETRRNSGRLVAFSDGVVAIAITLLILPLADISLPSDNDLAQSNPLEYVWQQDGSLIRSFLVSWFVIFIFWLAHHRMFDEVERVNSTIIKWNVLWLFGIVILSFPLRLLDQVGPGGDSVPSVHSAAQQTTVFYIGILFFISLMLSLISREIRRNPSLLTPAARENATDRTVQSWIVTWYLLALLPVAWFAPQIALWALIGVAALRFISDKVKSIAFDGSAPPKLDS